MSLLAEILSSFIRRNSKYKDIKSNHIFYKIVDTNNNNEFTLQCINTNALFYAKISDIVYDTDILYGLHPVQSCFIGIEYAKYIKKHKHNSKTNAQKINQYSLSRYGCYSLCYQNRNGELCFINNITNEQFIMDSRDVALSEELINEFDAAQAFYIGLLAGLKINNLAKQNENYSKIKRPLLYVVK
jgi:hypothetical protein